MSYYEKEISNGKKDGKIVLTPREAVLAMLAGAVLQTAHGNKYKWNEVGFVNIDTGGQPDNFRDLFHIPEKKSRPMTKYECMAWAHSPESYGWFVINCSKGTGEWEFPIYHTYLDSSQYQRARLLPDKSDIDESTIQGFTVRE